MSYWTVRMDIHPEAKEDHYGQDSITLTFRGCITHALQRFCESEWVEDAVSITAIPCDPCDSEPDEWSDKKPSEHEWYLQGGMDSPYLICHKCGYGIRDAEEGI